MDITTSLQIMVMATFSEKDHVCMGATTVAHAILTAILKEVVIVDHIMLSLRGKTGQPVLDKMANGKLSWKDSDTIFLLNNRMVNWLIESYIWKLS
jgi:hypothetical protein